MRQALTDLEDACHLHLNDRRKAKILARKQYRKARRRTYWQQAVALTRVKQPLVFPSFGGSGDKEDWPRLLKAACEEKYVADDETLAAMQTRQQSLWKIAEMKEMDDDYWFIKASDVLMARARMNKHRTPGDDGVVTEMVLLLPLCAMYLVARLFDDRFWGRCVMAVSWCTIIMRFLRKELRPKVFRQLRGLCLLSSRMKLFVLT